MVRSRVRDAAEDALLARILTGRGRSTFQKLILRNISGFPADRKVGPGRRRPMLLPTEGADEESED